MNKKLINPHLKDLDIDYLYHLGLDTTLDLAGLFGDTKFVCFSGSGERAKHFAKKVAARLRLADETDIKPIGKTERYHLYKVGPVISVSHGMGMPSVSILLNEITKLLCYAGSLSPLYIRMGTCGGLGVKPGTVVITTEALGGNLEAVFETHVLGRSKRFPATLDEALNRKLAALAGELPVTLGKTLCADGFYEEQGRLDGALDGSYAETDKMNFLARLHQMGVVNIEMESLIFAAFCSRAQISAAVVCATLIDRLKGDQVSNSAEDLARYADLPQELVLRLISENHK